MPLQPKLIFSTVGLFRTPSVQFAAPLFPDSSPDLAVVATIFWQIWKKRNHFIFRNQRPNPSMVVESALAQLSAYQSSAAGTHRSSIRSGLDSVPPDQLWRPPSKGVLRCNIDGSYQQNKLEGSMASICRDDQGKLTDIYSRCFPATSPFESELQALNLSLQHLYHRGFHNIPIDLHTDCLQLVEIVKGLRLPPWEQRPIIDETLFWLSQFPLLSLQHCRRSANLVADWAAKAQLAHPAQNFNLSLPPDLLDLLFSDASAAGCNFHL